MDGSISSTGVNTRSQSAETGVHLNGPWIKSIAPSDVVFTQRSVRAVRYEAKAKQMERCGPSYAKNSTLPFKMDVGTVLYKYIPWLSRNTDV